MRQHIESLAIAKDWLGLRQLQEGIIANDDAEELRLLGLAFLYTGGLSDALRLFRRVRGRLIGRSYAATLVDGASALALVNDYTEASEWLDLYFQQDIRPYDGPALECQAYCLWKLGVPVEQVDAAYQQATDAFADRPERAARMTIDRIQMLIEHGWFEDASRHLAAVAHHGELAGKILATQARLLAATGDTESAKAVASQALGVLFTSLDRFGNILREICGTQILLGELSGGSERLMWAEAAKASAIVLNCPSMIRRADQLRREADVCVKAPSGC